MHLAANDSVLAPIGPHERKILISLLIQAFAVFLVVRMISRVRGRWRHRRELAALGW